MHKCFGCDKLLKTKYICDDCVSKIFDGIFWESIIGYVGGQLELEQALDFGYEAFCVKVNDAFISGKIQHMTIENEEIKDGESLIKLMRVGR